MSLIPSQMGWGISATPRPLHPGKEPVPFVQEAKVWNSKPELWPSGPWPVTMPAALSKPTPHFIPSHLITPPAIRCWKSGTAYSSTSLTSQLEHDNVIRHNNHMQHNADCKSCRGFVKTHPGTNRWITHLWKICQHMGTALLLGTGFWMSTANSNTSESREEQDSYFLSERISVCHNTQTILRCISVP
jgi:hypothetical protein